MTDSSEQVTWDQYNGLMLGPDNDRIRKLIVRYELFRKSLSVPGDIVECGVFKGVGAMYWVKLLAIYAPASLKKVVGFDTFTEFADSLLEFERDAAKEFTDEAAFDGASPTEIMNCAEAAGLGKRLELVVGDVLQTAPDYAAAHPGFRISLLHLDLDTFAGTKAVLESLYDRVAPGGIIVCDEYGSPEWGESDAVDAFFAGRGVRIEAIEHSTKPTAYIVKPDY